MTDPQAPADQPVTDTPPVEVTELDPTPTNEPPAATAGEEDHSDPDTLRGDDADAPADTGTPPQDA